jgi:hypothetical protein
MAACNENARRENMAINAYCVGVRTSDDTVRDRYEGKKDLHCRSAEIYPPLNRHAKEGLRLSRSYSDQERIGAGHYELEKDGIANLRVEFSWHFPQPCDW